MRVRPQAGRRDRRAASAGRSWWTGDRLFLFCFVLSAALTVTRVASAHGRTADVDGVEAAGIGVDGVRVDVSLLDYEDVGVVIGDDLIVTEDADRVVLEPAEGGTSWAFAMLRQVCDGAVLVSDRPSPRSGSGASPTVRSGDVNRVTRVDVRTLNTQGDSSTRRRRTCVGGQMAIVPDVDDRALSRQHDPGTSSGASARSGRDASLDRRFRAVRGDGQRHRCHGADLRHLRCSRRVDAVLSGGRRGHGLAGGLTQRVDGDPPGEDRSSDQGEGRRRPMAQDRGLHESGSVLELAQPVPTDGRAAPPGLSTPPRAHGPPAQY